MSGFIGQVSSKFKGEAVVEVETKAMRRKMESELAVRTQAAQKEGKEWHRQLGIANSHVLQLQKEIFQLQNDRQKLANREIPEIPAGRAGKEPKNLETAVGMTIYRVRWDLILSAAAVSVALGYFIGRLHA